MHQHCDHALLTPRPFQGEEGFRRDSCLRNPSPWPAGSMGCRREAAKPSGARESRARKGSVVTHVSETQVHGRLAAWAAGGNGREFRSPLEQGSPGRGRVPSRLMSPKPKSLACWQHGLPAGTATTVVVRFSDALRNSRCVGADVHTHARGTYARRAPSPGISAGPKPAVVALSSDMLQDSRCVGTDVHTHERGTYAKAVQSCQEDALTLYQILP